MGEDGRCGSHSAARPASFPSSPRDRSDVSDEAYIERAIELARRGSGLVSPTPWSAPSWSPDGAIVGEGFHEGPGLPHAEIMALNQAGERARGATLYTSLEPCDHYGRTPPCTEAIVRAGIARVVSATRDPNPVVDGQGIRTPPRPRRRGARGDPGRGGGSAERGVRQARSDRDAVRRSGRRPPRSTARSAARDGTSRWITGEARAGRRASAPSLGGRDRGGGGHGARRRPRAHGPRSRLPGDGRRSASWWTARGRVGPSGDLFDDQAPTLVATTELAPAGRPRRVARRRRGGAGAGARRRGRGAERAHGRSRQARRPGCAPGGRADARLVGGRGAAWSTRSSCTSSPKLIGGSDAPTVLEGRGFAPIGHALPMRIRSVDRLGEDLRVEADVHGDR